MNLILVCRAVHRRGTYLDTALLHVAIGLTLLQVVNFLTALYLRNATWSVCFSMACLLVNAWLLRHYLDQWVHRNGPVLNPNR